MYLYEKCLGSFKDAYLKVWNFIVTSLNVHTSINIHLVTVLAQLFFLNSNFIEVQWICHINHLFKVYNTVGFSILTVVHPSPQLILEHTHGPRKKPCFHQHILHFPLTPSFLPTSPALRQLPIYFLPLELPVLGIYINGTIEYVVFCNFFHFA